MLPVKKADGLCFVKYFSDIELSTGTYIKTYYLNGVFGSNNYIIFYWRNFKNN